MKKYTMLLFIIIISILVIDKGTVEAHHYGPEWGCTPDMYIEISGEDIFYDPLLSTDCTLWLNPGMSNFYELYNITVTIEHQRLIDGVWQSGPKGYNVSYSAWVLGFGGNFYTHGAPHFLLSGGYLIEGYNTTDYDRYRLIVVLEGASTHQPTFTGTSDYEWRTDEFATDWVYGLNAISTTRNDSADGFADQPDPDDVIPDRPTTEVNPDLDDAPNGFADQDDPDDQLPPARPADRDGDGIPDATDQCPDVVGIALLQGCRASADSISNGQNPNLPSTGLVCTVETSLAMTFFFDIAPSDPIPLGTVPIALTSIDISDANHVDEWVTARLSFEGVADGVEWDYMVRSGWSSLARVGGTCGEFGAIDNVTTDS